MRQVEKAKRELGATVGPARHRPGYSGSCREWGEPDLPRKACQPAQTRMTPRNTQDAQAIPRGIERQSGPQVPLATPHRMLGARRGRSHRNCKKRSSLAERGSGLSSDYIDSGRIQSWGWREGRSKSLGGGG